MNRAALTQLFIRALTFFPFFGWLLPLYLQEKSEIAQNNAKTAMLLAIYSFALAAGATFLNFLVPAGQTLLFFVFSLLLYIVLIAYLIICVVGTIFSVIGKELKLPYITAKALSFNL